jgi:hypothetical protein
MRSLNLETKQLAVLALLLLLSRPAGHSKSSHTGCFYAAADPKTGKIVKLPCINLLERLFPGNDTYVGLGIPCGIRPLSFVTCGDGAITSKE